MTALFPAFKIEAPHPGATEGYFCTKCGSRLMHQPLDMNGKPASTVSVKSGCLEGISKEMMRSAVHIWTRSAIIDIPDEAEAYEEEPPGGSFKGA
ncbi:hypothetical protein LTR37_000185 [Vermiconidia calcicola]|uniref:Uncharacterized protein n=1 Tax=Vermiconidia calcicola TaxID=1690605 RepID=A0ACC3P198_9PEZI|nr:hypothetical protein LTR37_000185 [Vermiconidia calcicola]